MLILRLGHARCCEMLSNLGSTPRSRAPEGQGREQASRQHRLVLKILGSALNYC